jgi:hypothetical protein
LFVGARGGLIRTCKRCQKLYRSGGRRATRRKKLDRAPELVRWVSVSQDRKLGRIPATYTGGSTCPTACPLRDSGCYAEFGLLRHQWERTEKDGLPWPLFLERVRALSAGQLWRHNIAGDLPGYKDKLDVDRLLDLVLANAGRRGFTFTHKPLTTDVELAAVSVANRRGFTVNLSADTLEQADELAALGIGPVVVTLPSDAPRRQLTPAGRHVVVCPAESNGLTCEGCQLCSKAQRKAIVGFRAHGQWHKRIDQRLRLPVVRVVDAKEAV